MARPLNDDLIKSWKIILPATLAGRIEYVLRDPVHNKPIYGARAALIESLLEFWLARESGRPLPSLPTILELREKVSSNA